MKIPTGIHVEMEENWVLKCYPRSGLGFKFRLQLNNTVGIIDSDYFYSDNEGHIFAKLTNDTNEGKIVIFGGGEPLEIDGKIIGAIGVSGGTAEQDTMLAAYGKEVLKEVISCL